MEESQIYDSSLNKQENLASPLKRQETGVSEDHREELFLMTSEGGEAHDLKGQNYTQQSTGSQQKSFDAVQCHSEGIY